MYRSQLRNKSSSRMVQGVPKWGKFRNLAPESDQWPTKISNRSGSQVVDYIVNEGIITEVENGNENDDQDEGAERHHPNHSARRFMLQKLDDSGVEHNHIKEVIN
ncbi:Hypothetical predicted protein [Mytilus galloprovincialis]|uniref:Uncharacterized protein n=1 Tax=Mytilus galloprovincialis TaxID=29158 RepID=A0A8B6DVF0_MYTGA|nr:Hypothetical predicted protein [Mytilus galloprovincialis]